MSNNLFHIQEAVPSQFEAIGNIMVEAYSNLPGFLTIEQAPEYFNKLKNIGDLTANEAIKILVVVTQSGDTGGAVVYFNDMKYYGSDGTATQVKNAAGFRFLAIDKNWRGHGLGRMLTNYCIELAKEDGKKELVIHTTNAMKVAWSMYEKMGFVRSIDLDFTKGELEVFGFRYRL